MEKAALAQPLFTAMRVCDRERYLQVLATFRLSLQGDDTAERSRARMAPLVAGVLAEAAAHAPDRELRQYVRFNIDRSVELKRRDPALCAQIYTTLAGVPVERVSAETRKREGRVNAELVCAAWRNPQPAPEAEDVADVFTHVLAMMPERKRHDFVNGLGGDPAFATREPSRYCDAVNSFYEQALRVPDPDAGRLFRMLFQEAQRDLGTVPIGTTNALSTKCGSGDARACSELGDMYAKGDRVAQSAAEANEWYVKSCALGSGAGCTKLGVRYANGRGVVPSMERANRLFEKACGLGDGAGCGLLGHSYAKGAGVVRDVNRSFSLFENGCGLGDPLGCANLGLCYATGVGVARNMDRAIELFKQSCGNGFAGGCTFLGQGYAVGAGVPQSWTQANALFEKACTLNEGSACRFLGFDYAQGNGVLVDMGMAHALWKKACSLGDADACTLSRQ